MRWTVTLRRTYSNTSIEVEVEALGEDEAREVAEAASGNGEYDGSWDTDYPEVIEESAEEAYAIEGSEESHSDGDTITLANGETWKYTAYVNCYCEHANGVGTICSKRPARWQRTKGIEGLTTANWLCDEHMVELEGKGSMESTSSLPNIPSDLSEYLQQLEEAEIDN